MKTTLTKTLAAGVAMLGAAGFATEGKAQVEEGVCGCMDVVFVIDDTGSMSGAIANVKGGINSIIAGINTASGNDAQMGVVTFKDSVQVDQQLLLDDGTLTTPTINAIVASGGAGGPEASDEALNTVVNALAARAGSDGFDDNWRSGCYKISVLITDNLPGGFDDTYTPGVDNVNADQRAQEALAAGILISAIQIDAITPPDPNIAPIMQNYATVTGGFYSGLPSDGTGTSSAISEIIEACGVKEIQAQIDIKFCSDPNAFNSKSKGKTPVTIFGSEVLMVDDIDIDSLELCLADESACVGPPEAWSIADRGDPSTDLGAESCAFLDEEEQDYLNPDGLDDIDVAFDSQDVAGMIGADGQPKDWVSPALVIRGETVFGSPILSAPIGDPGVDQLVKKNK